jgi:hypothetical protein
MSIAAKVFLSTVLFLAGCNLSIPRPDGPSEHYPPFPPDKISVKKLDDFGATLTRVEYEDGVRCVILALGVRRRGGGIECDYGHLTQKPNNE